MDGKPTGPEPGSEDPGDPSETDGEAAQREHVGVVELTRMVKDDGRALLVFRRREGT